jgi:hypothetical protein
MAEPNKINKTPASSLYKRTEPTGAAEQPALPTIDPAPAPTAKPKGGRGIKSPDKRVMVGAGIKTSEKQQLEAIAAAHGVKLNSIVAYLLRDGMRRYAAGELKIRVKTQSVIDMP